MCLMVVSWWMRQVCGICEQWKYTHKQDKLVYNEQQKPIWIQVWQVHVAETQISSICLLICSFRCSHSGTKHFYCQCREFTEWVHGSFFTLPAEHVVCRGTVYIVRILVLSAKCCLHMAPCWFNGICMGCSFCVYDVEWFSKVCVPLPP